MDKPEDNRRFFEKRNIMFYCPGCGEIIHLVITLDEDGLNWYRDIRKEKINGDN